MEAVDYALRKADAAVRNTSTEVVKTAFDEVTAAWANASAARQVWQRTKEDIVILDARCAVYYSIDTRSLLGLASHGPAPGSRISRACKRIVLRGVEAILDAEPEAVAAWRAEPWS